MPTSQDMAIFVLTRTTTTTITIRPITLPLVHVCGVIANCFLIKACDGLHPVFVRLVEIVVIGNNLVTFIVQECIYMLKIIVIGMLVGPLS